jgi:hypothetical protein
MTHDEMVREIFRLLNGREQRTIAVPIRLLQLLGGDGDAAIFLAQCLYWQKTARKDEQGWWCKPDREFEKLGFTEWKCRHTKKRLRRYLEWRVAGMPAKCHYRIKVDVLLQDLQLRGNLGTCTVGTSELVRRKPRNFRVETSELEGGNLGTGVNSTQVQTRRRQILNSDSYSESCSEAPRGTCTLDAAIGGACVVCGCYSTLNINKYSEEFRKRFGLGSHGYICEACVKSKLRELLDQDEPATSAAPSETPAIPSQSNPVQWEAREFSPVSPAPPFLNGGERHD